MVFGLGIMLMFVLVKMIKNFVIELVGVVGLSIICFVIGGFFFVSFVLMVIGLLMGEMYWFLVVVVIMIVVVVG